MAAKTTYFAAITASAKLIQQKVFMLSTNYYILIFEKTKGAILTAHYNQFARHFVDTVVCICHKVNITLQVPADVHSATTYPVVWDSFQLV